MARIFTEDLTHSVKISVSSWINYLHPNRNGHLFLIFTQVNLPYFTLKSIIRHWTDKLCNFWIKSKESIVQFVLLIQLSISKDQSLERCSNMQQQSIRSSILCNFKFTVEILERSMKEKKQNRIEIIFAWRVTHQITKE